VDVPRFYRSDLEFHRTLWQLSGNRFLAKALDNTVTPLFAFFTMKTLNDTVRQPRLSCNRDNRTRRSAGAVKLLHL
jgi:DNA-binding GntR family transcriptional regulator